MRYTTLLFDLDYTLFDSETSEPTAFAHTCEVCGFAASDELIESFRVINKRLWGAVEAGDLTPNDVRTMRFVELVADNHLDADPIEMADTYVYGLGAFGGLYPGARAVLDEVDTLATLALITNGIGEVQRARIERLDLDRYFDAIVISGEVGTAKPGSQIYDITYAALGEPDRATSLMIGDSLSSDIQGGIGYGIDTCWYDKAVSPAPAIALTHQVHDLAAIPEIVRTGPARGVSGST